MRAVVQRATQASVTVDGDVAGAIGKGVVVLLGVAHGDTEAQAEWSARKIAGLRIFEDADGKPSAGLLDVDGAPTVQQDLLYPPTAYPHRFPAADANPTSDQPYCP